MHSQSGKARSQPQRCLPDTCWLFNWQSLLGGPGGGERGRRLALPAPSSSSSSAFPFTRLHSVLKGSKLSAVWVWAATARAPLVSPLAISLVRPWCRKLRTQQMTKLAEMSEWTGRAALRGRMGMGRLRRDAGPRRRSSLPAYPNPTTRLGPMAYFPCQAL